MKTIKTIKRATSDTKVWSFGLMIGVCSFFSCVDDINFGDKFLEKAPSVDVNIDSIFSKGENAKEFLWHMYGSLNSPFTYNAMIGYNPLEALTDITHSYNDWGQVNYNYYPGTLTEANQEGWEPMDKFPFAGTSNGSNRTGIWITIRKGWIFLENIDRVPDLNDTEKSRLKGEAYMIMATRYFDAFRNFGGLPLVDHAFLTGELVEGGRATAEET
ncbi:MAG: RagB/SusD family nutrient uptake outer membrane protein, partial [Dysgonamonadaceae bacterium]|nr:RagB/SusD family nutrient uptake outer membrane protein [Dysgonamonadaceae bacterium]